MMVVRIKFDNGKKEFEVRPKIFGLNVLNYCLNYFISFFFSLYVFFRWRRFAWYRFFNNRMFLITDVWKVMVESEFKFYNVVVRPRLSYTVFVKWWSKVMNYFLGDQWCIIIVSRRYDQWYMWTNVLTWSSFIVCTSFYEFEMELTNLYFRRKYYDPYLSDALITFISNGIYDGYNYEPWGFFNVDIQWDLLYRRRLYEVYVKVFFFEDLYLNSKVSEIYLLLPISEYGVWYVNCSNSRFIKLSERNSLFFRVLCRGILYEYVIEKNELDDEVFLYGLWLCFIMGIRKGLEGVVDIEKLLVEFDSYRYWVLKLSLYCYNDFRFFKFLTQVSSFLDSSIFTLVVVPYYNSGDRIYWFVRRKVSIDLNFIMYLLSYFFFDHENGEFLIDYNYVVNVEGSLILEKVFFDRTDGFEYYFITQYL